MSLEIFGPVVAAQSSDQLATKPPIPSRRIDAERTGDLTEAPVPAVAAGVKISGKSAAESPADDSPANVVSTTLPAEFRVERIPVAGRAELLTTFGRLDAMRSGRLPPPADPPLIIA